MLLIWFMLSTIYKVKWIELIFKFGKPFLLELFAEHI